ncbi:uncharacterized protein B0H64DRAFT_383357 [Chaetomium fimeti]|uniref:F-box domain-containing protein n=1 Tax=Chaetomium fimeti TaxID=1854472 RepID=A0AAE0HS01_9PEZI|nr:hypothetical protein B0H64DRAFT_383357 [Chaetomium fimeti]
MQITTTSDMDPTPPTSGIIAPFQQEAPSDGPYGELKAEIEASLAEAKKHVEEEQFSQALRTILGAVNKCPCEPAGEGKLRHAKDKACHIAQCMLAVNSGDPFALYQVANTPCTCGYRWLSCTRPLHAVALDALADCLDKAGQYIAAFATALATIRLDPASAVGYCRGARIIRYLLRCTPLPPNSAKGRAVAVVLNEASGAVGAPSAVLLRGTLGRFVQSGLRITDRYRRGPKDTYNVVLQRMAYHLKCDTALRDPVKEFPREVLGMVFSHLSTADLLKCLRVNKQWNLLAIQDDSWNDLRLTRPGSPRHHFANFLQQHQGIKSLVISDASDFHLKMGHRFSQIVFGLPQLDRLCIGFEYSPSRPLTVDLGGSKRTTPRTKTRLTQLSLESFDLEKPVAQLITLNVDTLTALNLVNTGPGVSALFEPFCLPNLKKLRITGGSSPAFHPLAAFLQMAPVVIATPNLEQLYLDGFLAGWLRSAPPSPDWGRLWPSLRNVTLGPGMRCFRDLRFRSWNPRFLPPFPASLQSLELLGTIPDVAYSALFTTTSPAPAADPTALLNGDLIDHHLPNLEIFRCLSGALEPRHLERLLKPSVTANKLKVLELTSPPVRAPPPGPDGIQQQPPTQFLPARDLAFLDRCALHTLGLHDFNFFHDPTSRFGATAAFDGDPFVAWLDAFPDLHTLGLYPGNWEGVAGFITALIARPGIKAIHQRYLSGVTWDQARQLARERGVELFHTQGHLPAGWKVFEDLEGWV